METAASWSTRKLILLFTEPDGQFWSTSMGKINKPPHCRTWRLICSFTSFLFQLLCELQEYSSDRKINWLTYSAREYCTLYHQVKVARGHTNELHERLREVVRNNNVVVFHSCTLCCLQHQYDSLLFSSCFISCSNGLILQKMQFSYRAQLLSHLHSKTEIGLLWYNGKSFSSKALFEKLMVWFNLWFRRNLFSHP